MERSPDLETFIAQVHQLYASRSPEFVVDTFSKHPGTLIIGTEAEEWQRGHDVISAAVNIQLEEMPPLSVTTELVEAWEEGTIGWGSARWILQVEDGVATPFRSTIVARKEGTYWKIVTWHVSVPVTNEAVLGRTLTTAFDDLVALVENEPAPPSAIGADGTVTVVFTDIEGSTALMESLGEDTWTDMVAWHDQVITQHTRTFGGTVVKGQGDGFMLAFPAAGAATACALAVQQSLRAGWKGVPVPVRIGLHTGPARQEAGDYFGRTVIVAARVASAASGNEILVSQDVQAVLGGAFPLGEPETMRLKGLAGDFTIFPILSAK